LSSLTATKFISHQNSPATCKSLPETSNSRLVFVNGVYRPEQSDVSGLPQGIYVGNLTNLPAHCDVAKYLLNNLVRILLLL
ncbi:MAG: Fe-S cluster assembly protein SufD, partial [Cyanobacteria bacterium J06638_38]